MELQFKKRNLSCMETCLREVQNGEETLEIRLPDGMPDIGKILGAWGQPILRSKEWRAEQLSFSGGMMVWVLYRPEQGGEPRCLEGWVPFSMRWDLPDLGREGTACLDLGSRFVDARTVSARKVMVRAGLMASAEAWIEKEFDLYEPADAMEGVQLLRVKYPLRLVREAGEKAFQLSEELTLPKSAPQPDKLLIYTLTPQITEKKIVANKLVFRGNAGLHLVYASEDGQFHTWDFSLAFSQYAQLDGSFGTDASGDITICVTSLEVELGAEGTLDVKCAMTAQYIVMEQEIVEMTSDAYAPGRAVRPETQRLSIPVVLDSWMETVEAERALTGAADIVVDTRVTSDRPRQRYLDGENLLEFPGFLQVLYYGSEGELDTASGRFEAKRTVKSDPSSTLVARPLAPEEPLLSLGSDSMEVRFRMPVQFTAWGTADLEMISRISLGEQQESDPDGPSLILKRAGKESLWEIAKAAGSTEESIRKANGLVDAPAPGQLLLIPVGE